MPILKAIKEKLIYYLTGSFLFFVVIIGTLGGMVYFIYRGIDIAGVAIYEYWHDGNYLKSILTLLAASLLTTGIWVEINELALKISWWIFNSIGYQYGLSVIFLFCFATIAVSKAIKAKNNEKQAGEESHRD